MQLEKLTKTVSWLDSNIEEVMETTEKAVLAKCQQKFGI
jgi:hypothetical protein